MASYRFEKNKTLKDDFQLVREGWLRHEALPVYYTKNHFSRYVLSIKYDGAEASTNLMSSVAAARILGLLKKMGIRKSDLLNAKFPKGTDQSARNDLEQIAAALAAVEQQ